jgi:hypothetical protein
MEKNIEKIIEDICTLAPELAEKKEDVRKLVAELLKNRPDVRVDSVFVESLRRTLSGEIAKYRSSDVSPWSASTFMFNIIRSRAVLSFVVIVLVVLAAMPYVSLTKRVQSPSALKLALAPKVEEVGKEAFGTFVAGDTERQKEMEQKAVSGDVSPEAFLPQPSFSASVSEGNNIDNGGVRQAMAVARQDTHLSVDAVPSAMSPSGVSQSIIVLPAPLPPLPPTDDLSMRQFQFPTYVYKGELPNIRKEGNVYRRLPEALSQDVDAIVKALNIGLVDLGSFSHLGVTRFELASKDDPGYNIFVDIERGEVSIYHTMSQGYSDAQVSQMVNYADVDQAEMMKIANEFLAKHSIDVSAYGKAEIEAPANFGYADGFPGVAIHSAESVGPIYSMNVRYPLVIDGMKVVDPSGGISAGIMVSINARTKIVESVSGLMAQNYQRSRYALIQDQDKILAMVHDGGYGGYFYGYPEGVPRSELSVKAPEVVLMKYWKYEQGQQEPTELLIPALLFSVDRSANDQGLYDSRDKIVVPLVDAFLKEVYDVRPMISVPIPVSVMGGATLIAEPVSIDTLPLSQGMVEGN